MDWLHRLTTWKRRKAERFSHPRLVAYYWDGDAPRSHRVGDISKTGLYVGTEDRWYPGTLLRLTLQPPTDADRPTERSITVETRVVRVDEYGVGLAFVLEDIRGAGRCPGDGANRKMLEAFVQDVRRQSLLSLR